MIKKRGQITMYIILALILIIGVGSLLYLTQVKERIKIEEIIYPAEVDIVPKYIQDCARTAAKDAVIIMGSQAGFVEFPPEIEFERASYVRMDNFGLYKLPLWFFQGKSRIPPIDYMQFQISEYVKEHTLTCIDDFKSFEKQFDITVQDEMKVITTLTEENVLVEMVYPILIASKDRIFTTEKYTIFIPVRLKKVYDLAREIMAAENEQSFFENTTIDIMALNPHVPMDGMSVSCVPETWFLPEVKKQLQRTLQNYIGKARIKDTGYPPFDADLSVYKKLERAYKNMIEEFEDGLEDYKKSRYLPEERPADAWDYFHMFYDIDIDPTDLRVSFEYHADYGLDINANPNDNGVLTTKNMKGAGPLSGLFCLRQYHFVYDVQYPVKVIIRDPKSFEGEGYNFNFAFPVMVDDNAPGREVYSTTYFPEFREDTGFCEFVSGPSYEFRARGYVAPDLPPMDVKDVTISYKCFNQFCELGNTIANRGVYRLIIQLPEGCANPLIIAEKDSYIKDQKYLTEQYMTFDLVKLKNFTFDVVKHDYYAQDNQTGDPEPLTITEIHKEEAGILLKVKDKEFSQYEKFPGEDDNIQLIEDTATYTLDVYFILNGKIIGGYKNDDLTITYEELRDANHITFHVFRYHPSRDEVDQTDMALTQYLIGKDYQDQLKPTFSYRP